MERGRKMCRGLTSRKRGFSRALSKYGADYLFISPFFILFGVFGLFPLCYSIVLSLSDWHANRPLEFVGLRNYCNLVFWTSLWNVVYIFLVNVPMMTLLAITLAVILNSQYVRFKDVFRIVYLLPYVTSVLAVSIVFYVLFDTSLGLVNLAIGKIGIQAIPWITSPLFSKLSIVFMVTWKWVGYNMIIALAGLQSIDTQVYDAAKIDGAGTVRTFFRITIPMLWPVIFFMLIMSTIGTFNMFTEPYILTQGGPGYSSITLVLYLYRVSFKFFNLSYGSSIAIMTFLLILIPSLVQVKLMSKKEKDL